MCLQTRSVVEYLNVGQVDLIIEEKIHDTLEIPKRYKYIPDQKTLEEVR